MTTIVATSDLHGNLPELDEEVDILVIGGDITPLQFDRDLDRSFEWLASDFDSWLREQPAKHIVGIAGNHDFAIDKRKSAFRDLNLPWHYLCDSGVELEGIKFYGVPWVPNLRGWAFYGDPIHLRMAYNAVPDDTDVVISHGPPSGVGFMDGGHPDWCSLEVNTMIDRVKPKALICGHIHEGFGVEEYAGTTVYNVAYVDEFYEPRGTLVELIL